MTDWHAPNQQSVGIDPAVPSTEPTPQRKATDDKRPPFEQPTPEQPEHDEDDESGRRRRRRS